MEYKILYPDSPIVSKDVSEKLADNARNNENIGFKKGVKHKNRTTWNKGLTKKDERVKVYADKLKGVKKSKSHRENISISKTKNKKYDKCTLCNADKSKTNRNKCRSCAQKIRATKFTNGMKGRKLSEWHKMRLLSSQGKSFNKPERKVFEAYGRCGLLFTGDRKLWLKFKDGTSKNPDFIFDKYKICIEVYGDYWHRNDDPNDIIKKYEEIGWRCLVLWESEINRESISSLSEVINQFINYDNYFPYCNKGDIDYAGRFIV